MSKARKLNEGLVKNTKEVTISGFEFTIRVIDFLEIMGLSDEKMGIFTGSKEELGLKATQSVPKDLKEKYINLVGKNAEKAYMNKINETNINDFVKYVIPKGVIDPKIVDKKDINKETEVSLDLMLQNIDISVELANEILGFSIDNNQMYSGLLEK